VKIQTGHVERFAEFLTKLAKTPVRIRVERENSDGLGSEKTPLLSCWYDDRFARLGAAGSHPSNEFSSSPTQPDGRTV
jgi:hypothetical protein